MPADQPDAAWNAGFDVSGLFVSSMRQRMNQTDGAIDPDVILDDEDHMRDAKTQLKEASKAPMDRDEAKVLLERLMDDSDYGGDSRTFGDKLGASLTKTGMLPPIEIEYNNLTVVTDALVGAASNPTVWNSTKAMFKKLAFSGLKTQPLTILDNVSGVLKPGRMTLLLGPPGAGKSVMLQVLAGRMTAKKSLRITGDVNYNGVPLSGFEPRRTIGLIEQEDNHIPNMTVLETVNFAFACQISDARRTQLIAALKKVSQEYKANGGVSDAQQAGTESSDAAVADAVEKGLAPGSSDAEFADLLTKVVEHRLAPMIILKILGLTHTADTVAGGDMLRGVSGGERKRLTTAEILAGMQMVMMCDEISTGLDSATTASVCESLSDICHATQRTVLISLLQPPPEVLAIFDDVLLLTDGKAVFHGPVTEVMSFFEGIGFTCPARKDPASFLQEVTTPMGQYLYGSTAFLAKHGKSGVKLEALENDPPKNLLISVSELSDSFWKQSSQGKSMADQLNNHPFDASKGDPNALAKSKYSNSTGFLSKMVLKRQIMLTLREKAYNNARLVQTVVMGLIIASLFNNLQPPDDGRTVIALMALSVIFMSLMSIPQIGLVFQTKRTFYKHRDNNMFPTFSYSLGLALTQLPFSLIEALLYSVCVYFITNLSLTAADFFIFALIAWSASNCLAGLYRLVAYVSPTMVFANSLSGLVLMLMMVTNGFTIIRPSIPGYFIWVYYINPLAWAIRSLSVNELTSEDWGDGAEGSIGINTLEAFGFFTDTYWVWAGIGFLWGSLIFYTIVGAMALSWTQPLKPKPSVSEEDAKKEVAESELNRQKLIEAKTLKMERGTSAVAVAANDAPKELAFTAITLVCKQISYYVPDNTKGKSPQVVKDSADAELNGKLRLLNEVDFHVEPGQLTALMGGSGAGKTTLMDVVAGRKTQGLIRGDILVNGHPKQQETWARVMGYVEQFDIHSAPLSVRESLLFAARLRLDRSIPMSAVEAAVESAMKRVELTALADRVVGERGGDGLSGEQRKRLSIAVELVGNPAIMFMDEPTSGLDARAAAIVMRAVRNVADTGRGVLVTIHQPSMEIFEAFDQLVLLQRGGRLAYFGPLGPESCELIKYLEAQQNVQPIGAGVNPATWMLEVTGGSMAGKTDSEAKDFPTIYAGSSLCQANNDLAGKLAKDGAASHEPLQLEGEFATSKLTQSKWLIRKFFILYWNSPQYNFVRIIMTIIVALLYGLLYLNEGKLEEKTINCPSPLPPGTTSSGGIIYSCVGIAGVQNIMGLIFSMSIFLGMLNCMAVQPVYGAERPVFYRERAARMYSPGPYALASALAELPYLAAQAIIMVSITYWMVGFQAVAWKFFYFMLLFFLAITTYTYFGQFLVFATPSQLMAQLMAAACNQLFTYFNGFLVPYSVMPEAWKWMNRIVPTTWILEGLAGSQLGDVNNLHIYYNGQLSTVADFMSDYFAYDYSRIWWDCLIVLAYVLFFRLAATVLLMFVSFQKR